MTQEESPFDPRHPTVRIISGKALRFLSVGGIEGEILECTFHRTNRLSYEGGPYPLPPSLGTFPLSLVDQVPQETLIPPNWRKYGGVFFPMNEEEAFWIGFTSFGKYGKAIKFGCGNRNALTGEKWKDELNSDPHQDYMVVGLPNGSQPWLDGFHCGNGFIRQFVATPKGAGLSVEAQLTGEEKFGGIQMLVYLAKQPNLEGASIRGSDEASLFPDFSFSESDFESLPHSHEFSTGGKGYEEEVVMSQNRPGSVFGRTRLGPKDFEAVKIIGRGSNSQVLLVRHRASMKPYAMKMMKLDVGSAPEPTPAFFELDHPFIVVVEATFRTTSTAYFVMEFLSGGELWYHLKEEARFPLERARLYAAEIILALEYLHKNSIVYRDLKPDGCLLNGQGHAVLKICALSHPASEPSQTLCGTPEYTAPEILTGGVSSYASDVWALGIILYEMIIGIPPFYAEDVNEMYELILHQELTFPRFVQPMTRKILSGLLTRDPDRRLGCGEDGFRELKSHPFFACIDWDAVLGGLVTPQFVPEAVTHHDCCFFDSEFLSERVTEVIPEAAVVGDHTTFLDFNFEGSSSTGESAPPTTDGDIVAFGPPEPARQ